MTTICAVNTPMCVYFGADKRTGVEDMYMDIAAKILRGPSGDSFLAISGYRKLNDLVQRDMSFIDSGDPTLVSTKLRDLVLEDGWNLAEISGGPRSINGAFLYAAKGLLWWGGGDFSIDVVPYQRLIGIGSGRNFALGAAKVMYANCREDYWPTVIERSIQIAAEFDRDTSGVADCGCIQWQTAQK